MELRLFSKATLVVAAMPAFVGCATPLVPADLAMENVTIYSGVETKPSIGTVAVRDGVFVAVDNDGSASLRAAGATAQACA